MSEGDIKPNQYWFETGVVMHKVSDRHCGKIIQKMFFEMQPIKLMGPGRKKSLQFLGLYFEGGQYPLEKILIRRQTYERSNSQICCSRGSDLVSNMGPSNSSCDLFLSTPVLMTWAQRKWLRHGIIRAKSLTGKTFSDNAGRVLVEVGGQGSKRGG